MHTHRLKDLIVLRARMLRAVDQLIEALDALAPDPDLEPDADGEPSLGSPESSTHNQILWSRGGDDDREQDSAEDGENEET